MAVCIFKTLCATKKDEYNVKVIRNFLELIEKDPNQVSRE